MTALLGEAHWDAETQQWVRRPFAPRALDFDLACDDKTRPYLRHTLLQKSNGDFYLLVWQEVSSFDTEKKQDIANAPAAVTLTLKTPITTASAYLLNRGTQPTQIWHSSQALTLSVPDEVLVVRLTPKPFATVQALPPPPSHISGTATGDAVTLSWSSAGKRVSGYFISRLGRFLGKTSGTTFTDTKLQPATGYPYEVRSYDAAGRVSASTTAVVLTRRELPDLIVTDISWTPGFLKPGDLARFGVTIKNIGTGPTPLGITHGIAFFVDGAFVSWSDTFSGPLLPGQSKTLTANNGPRGTATWTVAAGAHTVTAQVDDLHRITQSGGDNDTLKKEFVVTPP